MIYRPKDYRDLLHLHLERFEAGDVIGGVPLGVPSVDNYLESLKKGDLGFVLGRPGMMKCLGKDTKILMYDGTLKNVQDIKTGDQLMGVDSNARNVLSTTSGVDQMYWIRQNKGIDYRVNSKHIISLKRSKNEKKKSHGEQLNIPLDQLLEKPKSFLSRWKGYKTAVEFETKELPIDPYFMGVWLGDGNSKDSAITNMDQEIIEYFNEYANRLNRIVTIGKQIDRCPNYRIKGGGFDSIQSRLTKLNVLKNKHIPEMFLINSRENRLLLLAGLIDSDGTLSQNNTFRIMQKSNVLSKQIKFLCDSLGFRCSLRKQIVKYKDVDMEYNNISICGNIEEIPCLVKRKQKIGKTNRIDCTMTGISIEKDSVDEYYGFELDGDGLFLLEDMTVTHNTGILITLTLNATFVYLSHKNLFCPPIYVTKETTVEDLALKILSNYSGIDTRVIRTNQVVDWGALHQDVDKMTKELPIIFIGHSIYDESKRKHLDYKLAENEIKQIHDEYGLSSIMVAADYLQRFNMNNSDDPRMMYSKMIDMSKEFAMEEKTTWVWGCQAKRDVDARKFPVPQIGDGMDTSNIEHSGDWIVSGMRPCRVEGWNVGDIVPYSKENIIITKDLYYLAVLKQKNGDAGQGFWCSFDPRITSIADR